MTKEKCVFHKQDMVADKQGGWRGHSRFDSMDVPVNAHLGQIPS